jgi:hypothetical protein
MGPRRGHFGDRPLSHAGASTNDLRALKREAVLQRAVALAPALLQGLRTIQVSVCAREGRRGGHCCFC